MRYILSKGIIDLCFFVGIGKQIANNLEII